jgi:hypothetical protein
MSIKLPEDSPGLIINLKPYSATNTGIRTLGTHPTQPVDWSEEIQSSLLTYYQGCQYPYRRSQWPPFPEPLRSEVVRFNIALDAYIESEKSSIPIEYLINGVCSGPSFAKSLKNTRVNSILHTWEAISLEENEDLRDLPHYYFIDIGQIFNYNFLINWREPDPEDYLYGWEPYEIDMDLLAELKGELKDLLDTLPYPDIIDPITILADVSGSKSLDPVTLKKGVNWTLKDRHNTFAKSIGTGKRMVLQVSPNNLRDTILLSTSSLNTVKLIEQQLQVILENIDESLQVRDPNLIQHKLDKMKKFKTFLMRDITKEGITKPRELLKIALEALNEKYPEIIAFQNTSFFDDYSLMVNDEILHPIRGHGLGMANALTTFLQVGIYYLVLKYSDSDNYKFEGNVEALTLNDDFVAGFESVEDFESYNYNEDLIFPRLGLLRSKKKSFFCHDSFVIAERYYNKNYDYDKKESYHRREIMNCFSCSNIVQAKQLLSSVVSMKNIDIAGDYIEEIITYWGYEFFPEEINYPAWAGGWFSLNLEGVSVDLINLDKLPYGNKVVRAYRACRHNSIKIYKKNRKKYIPPILKILKPQVIPEEFWKMLDIGTYGDMFTKFFRSAESPQSAKLWANLLNKRQTVFKNFEDSDMPYEDFIEMVVKDHSTKTFYPIDVMTSHYIRGTFYSGFLRDVYLSRNPKLSLLKKYNPIIPSEELGESFSIHFTKKDTITRSMNSDIRRRLKGSIFNLGREDFVFSLQTGYFDSDQIDSLNESYLNPQSLARVASMIAENKVPILFERYRSPLIEEKRSIYGRFLSCEELELVGKLKRTLIKDIIDFHDNEGLDIEFILESLVPEETKKEEVIVEEEQRRAVDIEDFWTWRTDRYPICEPFDRIFAAADEAIIINSFKKSLPSLAADRDLDIFETVDIDVQKVAKSMRTMYPLDTIELNLAISLYSSWEEQGDILEDEGIGDDLFALFTG